MKDLLESSLTRLYQTVNEFDVGTITAFRGDKTKAENKENNKQLLAYLRNKGYSVTKIKGSFIENFGTPNERVVSEDSFFVADIGKSGKLKDELKKLGEFFNQDAILFKKKDDNAVLIGTSRNPDAYPPYGIEEQLGDINYGKATGQFFSRINGRKFAFESTQKVETLNTISGRIGILTLSSVLEDRIKEWEKGK